jgi:hypothetical protein
MVSPFFRDLPPLPSDGEVVDGLPVVQLSEDAELLRSLVSMVYPVPSVMPSSNLKEFSLLAACQKYEMVSIQSSVHVSYRFWDASEAFRAYAIASRKRLTEEMERAARYTLEHPMTFETLGEGLRLFEGWALRDLVRFRKRCRDNIVACLESFLEVRTGPSRIWVGCPNSMRPVRHPRGVTEPTEDILPKWLCDFLTRYKDKIQQGFTGPLDLASSIHNKFLTALRAHADCHFCLRVYVTEKGSNFCGDLYWKLLGARLKVETPFLAISHPQRIIHPSFHWDSFSPTF